MKSLDEDSAVSHSILVRRLYEMIPESDRREILVRKKTVMNKGKTRIRVQAFIPNDVYAVLEKFGAFINGETNFFSTLATEWCDKKASMIPYNNGNGAH